MKDISIILPTYNEEENISLLIDEIIKELFPLKIKYEIIVVDDNSDDRTIEKVKKISEEHKNIMLIARENEKGFASAILTGIKNSKYDYVLSMNSDFGHPPKYLPRLIENIQDNDMIIASRYMDLKKVKITRFQDILSLFLNLFLRIFLRVKATDLTCCFMIIKKEILKDLDNIKIFNYYGDWEFKILYKLKGKIKIGEVPFNMETRKYGKSKTKVIKCGIIYIKDALKLRFSKNTP